MFTHILLQLLTGFTLTVAIFAFDLPDSCVAKSCERIADGQCDLSIEHWAVYKYIGQTNCACCKGERDAAMIVGNADHKTDGLFYGDRYKMCETVYIDQVSCWSRQTRDCNYKTLVHRNKYIGCFYCRPRCESDVQCADINRVCAKCRDDQPVPACTEPIFARKSRGVGNDSLATEWPINGHDLPTITVYENSGHQTSFN